MTPMTLRKIYIFFFFLFKYTAGGRREERSRRQMFSGRFIKRCDFFLAILQAFGLLRKWNVQTKKLKRTNNKTVKSCNLSKIQLRKDCCTSPRLQYKLKTSWFHPTHKKNKKYKNSLVPPKKKPKMCIITIKISHGRFFFFGRHLLKPTFWPCSQ